MNEVGGWILGNEADICVLWLPMPSLSGAAYSICVLYISLVFELVNPSTDITVDFAFHVWMVSFYNKALITQKSMRTSWVLLTIRLI